VHVKVFKVSIVSKARSLEDVIFADGQVTVTLFQSSRRPETLKTRPVLPARGHHFVSIVSKARSLEDLRKPAMRQKKGTFQSSRRPEALKTVIIRASVQYE
jgi:hypothetical protein